MHSAYCWFLPQMQSVFCRGKGQGQMETEMTKERARMQELIETLNRASKAYYA